MSNQSLLSVIIPCYNCAETLTEAVDSCYRQGFSDSEFEIVLVDDCSTDTTHRLAETLAAKHLNLRLLTHTTNQGGGAARNTAARAAVAPVIFCLDSDDLLPPGTLRKMYNFLRDKNADGVGLHHSTKFRGTNTSDIAYADTFGYAGEKIPLESLLQKNNVLCPLYSVFMYTKSAFITCGGYPTNHGFDTQSFAWRFLAAGLVAYTCPDTNYLHRVEFHQSYYLREYAGGKININWQQVLLEHQHLFSESARTFIKNFPLRDFTRSVFGELCKREDVFLPEAQRRYGVSALNHKPSAVKPVERNSAYGIYLRIKRRLKHYFA